MFACLLFYLTRSFSASASRILSPLRLSVGLPSSSPEVESNPSVRLETRAPLKDLSEKENRLKC